MDFKLFSIKSWETLDISGNKASGYISMRLSLNDEPSSIHIFKDEKGECHFVIEAPNTSKSDIEHYNINGLNISINQYRLNGQSTNVFIDIRCEMSSYLEEFTEVTKEIAKSLFEKNEKPSEIVNRIVRNWKSFWSNKNKGILSEEKLIGTICELTVLRRLILINNSNALKSWRGPFAETHDFIFTDWNFEVKGTRSNKIVHTINGIDQLKPLHNKRLAFISFLVSVNETEYSVNLPDLVEQIKSILSNRPDLIVTFNESLAESGYSPFYDDDYRKFKVEVIDSALFEVDNSFPSLTVDNLNQPLNSRITSVRYDISLEGFVGRKFSEINLGEYFY